MAKPSQDDIIFLEIIVSHGLDASPFNHPLDVHWGKMLQEFRKCSEFHLFDLELVISIMFQLIPIE